MEKRIVVGIGIFWGTIALSGVLLLRRATQSSLDNQREKREAAARKMPSAYPDPVDSGPPPGEAEVLLRETMVTAKSGEYEVRPVWFRASCVDEFGTLVETCEPAEAADVPVFGIARPAEIGFFSVVLQRSKPDGTGEHVGYTAVKKGRSSAPMPVQPIVAFASPRCSVLEANALAKKAGFEPKLAHQLVWESAAPPAKARWTFVRGDSKVVFDDDCVTAP